MDFFEKLGIGFPQIIFYAITLAILVVALYLLLFKPVKKMMANHRKKLDDICEENKVLQTNAQSLKSEYDQKLEAFKVESASLTVEAAKAADTKSEIIIEEARKKAGIILEEAKREAAAEKLRTQTEYKETVSHLAVDIAEKILEREVSEKDNKRLIDDLLEEWTK